MTLHSKDIKRAIYLDFESEGTRRNGDQPEPVLGGALIDSVYVPTLLHPSLKIAAEAKASQGWKHASLANYLQTIYEQAVNENRRIVFFSSTEWAVFKENKIDIGEQGFDLRKPAKKSKRYKKTWRDFKSDSRRFRDPNTPPYIRNQLRTKAHGLLTLIAQDIGLPRPGAYGAGKVGVMIRYALDQAQSKPDYELWSRSGKRKLSLIVKHNTHDCKATQFVLKHLYDNERWTIDGMT